MKSAVFYGKHTLRIVDSPMPAIGPHDALVRVRACGVCGTDVHIYAGDQGAADVTPPVILGHEFAGEIVELGSQVKGLHVGDRVCVDPNEYCCACDFCKRGIAHFCENMVGIGTTIDGGFAEYCRVPARQLYKIADHVSFEQAAMAEPVACCLHGIDLCEIKPASTVLVIGGGMIGLLMLQLARLSGAYRTVLLEPVEEKRAVGKALGADLCIDPIRQDVKQVLTDNGVDRVDVVIECAGLPSTIVQAMDLVGKYGLVMMFGLTKPDDTIPLKPFDVFRKEFTIKASFINPYTLARAVDLINAGKLDVSSMVYKTPGLEGLEAALSDPAERAKGKFIIIP